LGGFAVRAGSLVFDGTNNPLNIPTGLTTTVACYATNGDPASRPGQVTGISVGGGSARVHHTFGPGHARVNWFAVGML
jgi:hypothetical protein